MLTSHIFRAYDIRGLAHQDFDAAGAEQIGYSYTEYLKKRDGLTNPKLVIGRDGRLSSEEMQQACISGMQKAGAEVTDIGLSTSPLLFFSICYGDFDGGINITASHNPREYNGFKLQGRDSHAICGEEIQKIWQHCQSNPVFDTGGTKEGNPPSPPYQGETPSTKKSFWKEYLAKITSLIDIPHRPKVVLDCGNGVPGAFAQEIFEALDCEVIPLYTEVDGNFPNHDADPEVEENLADLKKMVLAEKANLGIAFDGDGDRLGVVDAEGKHYAADLLLLLLSRDLLSRHKNAKVVIDLKATQVLFDDIAKRGGEGIMVQTGHSFVEEKMREVGALLGGEVSGHIFFGENYYGFDDAFLAAAKLLEILGKSGKTIAEHLENLPVVYTTPEIKVECAEDKKFAVIDAVREEFLKKYGAEKCLTIDGVRVDFGEGAWGICRASNTSPKITLRFEARDEKTLEKIQKEVMAVLEEKMGK